MHNRENRRPCGAKDFENWALQLEKTQKVAALRIITTDKYYKNYIFTLHDGKILECEVSDNADVVFARFDHYYFYAELAYTPQEKADAYKKLMRAAEAIIDGKYFEQSYWLGSRLLKRKLHLEGDADKVNFFHPRRVRLLNHLLLCLPQVKVKNYEK